MNRPPQIGALIFALTVLTASGQLHSQNVTKDEVARSQFENGRGLMRKGSYEEALKDFRTVAESYPDSSLADNARLEISRYYLEIGDDPAMADKVAEDLIKQYPTSDSAPFAYIVRGQVLLERSRRKEDLEIARASFDRVPRIYGSSEAVPRALYLEGEALRLAQKPADALGQYRHVIATYPSDPIIPKVHIGAGMALAATGNLIDAMEEFQLARTADASAEDSQVALARLTALYRLYVRPPQVSPYTYAPNDAAFAGRVKEVHSIIITSRGEAYLATKSAILPLDPSHSTSPPAAAKPRGLTVDRAGRLIAIEGGSLKRNNGPALPLSIVQGGANKPLEETDAAVSFKSGDWLVAGDDDRGIQRFAGTGKHVGSFSSIRTARLAINEFDQVAALDRDAKAVSVFDEAGKAIGSIARRGVGYELKNPVDLAFDAFGHLYVLDRAAVFVFAPMTGALLRTYTEPETSAGAFRRATAFALDGLARLYIADDQAEKIRVYQ
jgi:TolA-binding protein